MASFFGFESHTLHEISLFLVLILFWGVASCKALYEISISEVGQQLILTLWDVNTLTKWGILKILVESVSGIHTKVDSMTTQLAHLE